MFKRRFSKDIPFLKYRKVAFTISMVLIVLALAGLVIRGVNLGIEFEGGTSIDFSGTGKITIDEMRDALNEAGEEDAVIQTTEQDSEPGFLVRTSTTDPKTAAAHATAVAKALQLDSDSYRVTTIGPDWGGDITKSSLVAFVVAIGLIILYITIRFEFKMSLTAVSSLVHDLIIVAGIYAWTQIEVTPNVIAALLTIMGYSLYDTVVVFHRIGENSEGVTNKTYRTFSQISNHSINQVFIRTINTALTSLIPVICMLIFGGDTLKDFALAMFLGLMLAGYSSIFISTPLFVMWKNTEDKWKKLEKRFGEKAQKEAGLGDNGAVATPEDTSALA